MLRFVNDSALNVAVSLAFFVFGFVLGADFFQLTSSQIVTALIAGAACGITILVTEYCRSRRQHIAVRDRLTA